MDDEVINTKLSKHLIIVINIFILTNNIFNEN